MSTLLPFVIFVTLLTISHGCFLIYGRKHKLASVADRTRWWQIHLTINGPLWIVTIIWFGFLQMTLPRVPTSTSAQVIGSLMIVFGVVIVSWSRLLLGRDQAMGIRFFLPERARHVQSGLYRYLNNPMYDGFLLVLVGCGLVLGITYDYFLALVSFILLNLFLARAENFDQSINPF